MWVLPCSARTSQRMMTVVGAAVLGLMLVTAAGCEGGGRHADPDAEGRTPRAVEASSDTTTGWRPLFDGRTLGGWVQRGGRAAYRVENGEIVGATRPDQPNSFLCTRQTFADFELDLEFKVDPQLNSGIQIRSQARPDVEAGGERVYGYQVEIDPSERAWTGGLYEEAGRGWIGPLGDNAEARGAFKQGEWNHFRIEARGDVIRTWINGVPGVEVHDAMTRSGFIALQVHGVGERADELTVRWRGLQVRELNEESGRSEVGDPQK